MATWLARIDGQGVQCKIKGVFWRYSSVKIIQRDIDNLQRVIAQVEARLARDRRDLQALQEAMVLMVELRAGFSRAKNPGSRPRPAAKAAAQEETAGRRGIRRLDPGEVRRRSDARDR